MTYAELLKDGYDETQAWEIAAAEGALDEFGFRKRYSHVAVVVRITTQPGDTMRLRGRAEVQG